jgi:hypothetical protein
LFEFTKVIVQDTSRIVSTAFITGLTSSLAGKCEHIVILQALLSSNSVIRIGVTHHKSRVVLLHLLGQILGFVLKALFSDDVFLSFRSIEIDWQFNTLGLVHSQGKVRLLLQILKLESLQVLLSESLSVELSSGSWRIAFLHRRSHERLLLAK